MSDGYSRVLIVEDDLALVPLWKSVIRRQNSNTLIEWAVSSEEALKLVRALVARNETIDLVVTDLFLAGSMTGLELLESPEVKALNCPAILVSAAEMDGIKDQIAGSDLHAQVIEKPLNVVKLERLLEWSSKRGDNETLG